MWKVLEGSARPEMSVMQDLGGRRVLYIASTNRLIGRLVGSIWSSLKKKITPSECGMAILMDSSFCCCQNRRTRNYYGDQADTTHLMLELLQRHYAECHYCKNNRTTIRVTRSLLDNTKCLDCVMDNASPSL